MSRHIALVHAVPAVAVLAVAALAVGACSKDSGSGAGSGSAIAMAGSGSAGSKKGGGFSASLSAEMAKEGATPGSAAGSPPPSTTPMPSGTGTNGGSNGGTNAGSNQVAGGTTTSAAAKAPDTKTPDTKASDTKTPDTKAPDTKAPDTKAPDTKAPDTKAPDTKTAAATPAAGTTAGTIARPTDHRGPVSVPADLAAIKMDLEPNWDRDYDEAGTISFVLKVPNTTDTRVFSFHYGYDPSSAPSDRDAYMAWLADQKLLSVTLNRQRGAAWYLEGTNGSGAPAFRYLVMYGGKHLVCWGTLYKDAASNPLGDLRDKVVMAAKKICETMTL